MQEKLWLSFTGVDGCGKTTASQYASARLAPRSKWWKHPYHDWVRDMMKVIGKNHHGVDVYSDALAFAVAHRVEQYLMREWWKTYDVLVSQRGNVDYFAFLNAEGMSFAECEAVLKPSEFKLDGTGFAVPNAVVYLDCEVNRALGRIEKEDKWEVKEFLLRLRDSYERFFARPPEIFHESRLYRIDANPPVEVVQRSIDVVVQELKDSSWKNRPRLGASYVRV